MPPPYLHPAFAEILEGLRGDRNEFADYDQDGKDLKAGAMEYDAIEFEARTIMNNLDNAYRKKKVIDEKEVMGHDQTGEASGGGPKGSDTSAPNSNAAMIESIQKLRRSLESPDTIPRFPCEEVGCTKRYHDWLLLQMHVREMHEKPPVLPAISDGKPPAVPAVPDAPLKASDTKDAVPSSRGFDNAGFGSTREWIGTAKDIASTDPDPKSEYRKASFDNKPKGSGHSVQPDGEDESIGGQLHPPQNVPFQLPGSTFGIKGNKRTDTYPFDDDNHDVQSNEAIEDAKRRFYARARRLMGMRNTAKKLDNDHWVKETMVAKAPMKQRSDSTTNDGSDNPAKEEGSVVPEPPVVESYTFTLLDPTHPGEKVSWTKTRKAKLRAKNHELYEKALSYESRTGWDCNIQLAILSDEQLTLVQRLLEEKNKNEETSRIIWTLLGARKLYEERENVAKTRRFNHAICVTVMRGDAAVPTEDKSADKRVSSDRGFRFLVKTTNEEDTKASKRESHNSKGKKSVGATKPPAARQASSPSDTNGILHAPGLPPPGPIPPHPQSGDRPNNIHGTSSMPPPLPPSAIPVLSRSQYDGTDDGELKKDTPDRHVSQQHGISRLQENVPDIRSELQDVKQDSSVHKTFIHKDERGGIMKAFLDRERGKQPGSRNNNTLNARHKLRRSVNDLEIPVEGAGRVEQTIPAGDSRTESFRSNFRDADTEASGSHDWKLSSGSEAGMTEAKDMSKARTLPHYDSQEASPPGEPRSTQIETAPEYKPHIQDDVEVAAFSVAKSSWSQEPDAKLSGDSQLSIIITEFLISTNDLEPILIVSLLGMGIHDTSERQLDARWYIVLGVVLVLSTAIAYLAYIVYIHLSLESSGNSAENDIPTADDSDSREFLYNSEVYNNSSAGILESVHKSYEKRILAAIGGEAEQSALRLEEDTIHHMAREISWVPLRYLTFSDDSSLSHADTMKAFIEKHMGESWNWWPLAPRLYQLRPGYFRLQWISPCGTRRHFDLPESVKNAVQQAIKTAPAFINIDPPSRRCAHSSLGHGSGHASTSGDLLAMSQSGPGTAAANSTSLGSSAQSQRINVPAPVASPGSYTAAINVQAQHVDQHLSLCVVSSSRHFVSLRCDVLGSDLELFAKMKADYDRNRGRLRLWFSMWRYKCSEFVLFHKYGYRRGARVDVGFPDDNNQMYHFLPRKPTPPPPNGPISKEQFQDHYYLDHCPCLYDWKRYQLSYRGHFNKTNRVALDAVPKRLVRINMDDGVDEHFYGLYAKEERSFLRVAIYAFLCNLPGVIFFFLWLFQWQHASDLQNASVPLTLSLSLTLGFAAVVFGTRDGD